jgi:polyhydroxyalkanoate synthesis regulator phasin
MNTAIDIVLKLVKEGKVTHEEAKTLLVAINDNTYITKEYVEPYKQPYTTEPYKWDITCNNK